MFRRRDGELLSVQVCSQPCGKGYCRKCSKNVADNADQLQTVQPGRGGLSELSGANASSGSGEEATCKGPNRRLADGAAGLKWEAAHRLPKTPDEGWRTQQLNPAPGGRNKTVH